MKLFTRNEPFRDYVSELLLDVGLSIAVAVIIVVPLLLTYGLPL